MNRTQQRQFNRQQKLSQKLTGPGIVVLPFVDRDNQMRPHVVGAPLVPMRVPRRKQWTPTGLIIYPARVSGMVTGPIINAV